MVLRNNFHKFSVDRVLSSLDRQFVAKIALKRFFSFNRGFGFAISTSEKLKMRQKQRCLWQLTAVSRLPAGFQEPHHGGREGRE